MTANDNQMDHCEAGNAVTAFVEAPAVSRSYSGLRYLAELLRVFFVGETLLFEEEGLGQKVHEGSRKALFLVIGAG